MNEIIIVVRSGSLDLLKLGLKRYEPIETAWGLAWRGREEFRYYLSKDIYQEFYIEKTEPKKFILDELPPLFHTIDLDYLILGGWLVDHMRIGGNYNESETHEVIPEQPILDLIQTVLHEQTMWAFYMIIDDKLTSKNLALDSNELISLLHKIFTSHTGYEDGFSIICG